LFEEQQCFDSSNKIVMKPEKTNTMKTFLILIIGLISSTGFAQTQLELNENANTSYKKADIELNDVYQKILSAYKSDTLFIKTLQVWLDGNAEGDACSGTVKIIE